MNSLEDKLQAAKIGTSAGIKKHIFDWVSAIIIVALIAACMDVFALIDFKTIDLFENSLREAKRVIINGPMGLFEKEEYSHGTKSIYDSIVKNNIKTLVGGGDSASSVNKLSDKTKFYHISTGGGATLEYLEGKTLPGISAIDEKEEI